MPVPLTDDQIVKAILDTVENFIDTSPLADANPSLTDLFDRFRQARRETLHQRRIVGAREQSLLAARQTLTRIVAAENAVWEKISRMIDRECEIEDEPTPSTTGEPE
jgi:hypothetical protein